jgi:hypothetical protein
MIGALHPTPGSSARGHVCGVQCFDGLHLNQKHAIDQQVREVLADHHVIVAHPDGTLLHNRKARSTKFICQRILIEFFQ